MARPRPSVAVILLIGSIAVAGLGLGVAVGRHLGRDSTPVSGRAVGVDRHVSVPEVWVRTQGPGFAFSTPVAPAVSYGAVPGSGVAVASPGYQAVVDGLVFSAAKGELPPTTAAATVDEQLDGIARAVAVGAAGTETSRRRIRTPAGDALDYDIDLGDGRHLHGRVVIEALTAFTFSVVAAAEAAPPAYQAFLASATVGHP